MDVGRTETTGGGCRFRVLVRALEPEREDRMVSISGCTNDEGAHHLSSGIASRCLLDCIHAEADTFCLLILASREMAALRVWPGECMLNARYLFGLLMNRRSRHGLAM